MYSSGKDERETRQNFGEGQMSVSDLLDITCNLYKKTKIQDAVGGSDETEILRISNIPCRIVYRSSDERTLLGREGVVATHNIYIALNN